MMNRRKVLTGGLMAAIGSLPLMAYAKIPKSSKPIVIESEIDAYDWIVGKYREGPTTYNIYAVTGEEYVELLDPYRYHFPENTFMFSAPNSVYYPHLMTGLSSPSSVWRMFELSFNMYEHRVTDGKDKSQFRVYFRIKPELSQSEISSVSPPPITYRGYCRLLLSDEPQLEAGEV